MYTCESCIRFLSDLLQGLANRPWPGLLQLPSCCNTLCLGCVLPHGAWGGIIWFIACAHTKMA